jgi:nicotinate-nucleotide adenylyltransferase
MGGTFDPVHLGHLELAKAVKEELELPEVIMMPAFIQPFKRGRNVASAEDRFNMLALSVKRYEGITVSDFEIKRGVVSYTYDTLAALKKEHPDVDYTFIMGSDSLLSIDTWFKGPELLKECDFAVGMRTSTDQEQIEKKAAALRQQYGAKITIIQTRMLPISSTGVREKASRRESLQGLVTPETEHYIYEHGLYI